MADSVTGLVGEVRTQRSRLERAHVAAVLDATKGHRGNAAHMLGISERNLYRTLREYGLLS